MGGPFSLRVQICYDPTVPPFSHFPALSDLDPKDWSIYGAWPGEESERAFGYIDKRPRPDEGYPANETPEGLPLYRHPEAIFRDADPDIKRVLRMWARQIRPETFTLAEYRRMSNFLVEAFGACRIIQAREDYRRIKAEG